MVEIGAAANLEIAEVHLPCVAAKAARILSRISAAARSVNVTATIRPGSTPRSRSSRYTSTSLRVFPVPALAHTTVFRSNDIFTYRRVCTIAGIHNRRSPAFRLDPGAVCHHQLFGPELRLSSAHHQKPFRQWSRRR